LGKNQPRSDESGGKKQQKEGGNERNCEEERKNAVLGKEALRKMVDQKPICKKSSTKRAGEDKTHP